VHWNLPKINQHGFRESRIENCVHVVLKPKTIRPSKIKEVDSGANETILMKNGLLACLLDIACSALESCRIVLA